MNPSPHDDKARSDPSGADLGIPDFELVKRIGKGSYGEVWLGRSATGSYRAVKIVSHESFDTDGPYEREFAGIQKFEPISRAHPGELDILHVGRNDEEGFFYYVMELADDASVEQSRAGARSSTTKPGTDSSSGTRRRVDPRNYEPDTLQRRLKERGRLSPSECLETAIDLAEALHHLHTNGLVHRDVKPSNIIFVRGRPKLADIGLVAHAEEKLSVVGTEGFIPPEGPGQSSADFYALGKVFYEMATGRDRRDFPRLPEPFEDPHEQRAFVEFNEVVMRCCERMAENRYEGAADLLTDLNLLRQGRSVRRLRVVERRLALMRRFALVAAAVTGVVLVAYYYQRAQNERLDEERRRAEAGELAARRYLYARDINLAQRLLQSEPARALRLLNRNRPQPGEIDLRGWEWRYLWQLCRSDGSRLLGRHPSRVYSVAAAPDGACVVVGDLSGAVQIWDGQRKEPMELQPAGITHTTPTPVAFSPRGDLLAAVRTDLEGAAEVVLWNWPALTECEVLSHPSKVMALVFFPDGSRLATFGLDEMVRVWRVRTGEELWTKGSDFGLGVYASEVVVSPGGDLVAAGGNHGRIWIYDGESGAELRSWQGHRDGGVTAMAFSPKDGLLASTSGYQRAEIILWDPRTGEQIHTLRGHSRWIACLAFSSDGEILASGSADESIRFWNPTDGRGLGRLQGIDGEIHSLAFAVGDKTIFSGSLKGRVREWRVGTVSKERHYENLAEAQLEWEIEPRIKGRGRGLRKEPKVSSPDGRIVVRGNPDQHDGEIEWRVAEVGEAPEIWRTKKAHGGLISYFVFTPDSRLLVSVGEDGMARIWRTETRELVRELEAGIAWSVDVSPSGDRILIHDLERAARIWDLHSGQELLTLDVDDDRRVVWVAFSPDERAVVAAAAGERYHVWRAPSFEEIEAIEAERVE